MSEYPFTPKSVRSIERGHFWSIPLENGTYGCGLVVEDRGAPDPMTSIPQTQAFMAALLDWNGAAPPTLPDIEAVRDVLDHGYAGTKVISVAGDQIRGQRDMDAHPVLLPDRVTHRAGGGTVWVVRGRERVRPATSHEASEMRIMPTLGFMVLANQANRRWASS